MPQSTQIPLSLEVLETDNQLVRLMLNDIAKEFNSKISSRIPRIKQDIQSATFNFLRNTSTYQSLVSGELAAHFGIPSGGRQNRIDTIVKAVSDGMEVSFTPIAVRSKKFIHGINIRVLTTSLAEVLTLIEGVVTTEKGENLDWLKWLLTAGDHIIISEYEIHLIGGKGRSGGGIMVANNAAVWRVPPKFSGTIRKNWLTRAFTDNINTYLSIIEKIVQAELQRI